ncbi:protein kinase [Rubripirellula amarantea]|nr:protein kinase [Rubripirellula amarantea]
MNVPPPEPEPENAELIFFEALDVSAEDREAFLDQRCGDNADLRSAVAALLRADEEAERGFLSPGFMQHMVAPSSNDHDVSDADASSDDLGEPRFKILGKHRSGGLGDVYVAMDCQLGREVALKQIRGKWSDHLEAKRRFIQEAEVTGRLEHPGIVPVYAMGTWPNGESYYAMRFIEGETLAESIKGYHDADKKMESQVRRLKLRELLTVFIEVCNTIHYAHSKQVLHRDIKPSNVMVGPYGETLVVDWGLAKMLDVPSDQGLTENLQLEDASDSGSTETRVGGRVGTPQYMSPEQANGQLDEINKRTDIYLLGATLYQILTGSAPHTLNDECPTLEQLLVRIGSGVLKPPSQINLELSAPLEAICLKAMSKQSHQRYRNAAELADDVRRWLADESVSVHDDPIGIRAARWIRRHQAASYSMAVALILLTIGSIVGSLIWGRERERQYKISEERNVKAAELIAANDKRLLELRTSAAVSLELAQQELSANRLSSALRFLRGTTDAIGKEPQLAQEFLQIQDRGDRIERIVRFYHHADQSRLHNTMSKDAEAIVESVASLNALGIWNRDDWWYALPDQDLTPTQSDDLRHDVYQQLMVLDALLIKTIATRLAGADRIGTGRTLLPSLVRFLRTDIGKREARAAIVISDRLDRFRPSEAARWYRSVADYRLGNGMRLSGSDLGLTKNAADAQGLGVLCMIAGLDPAFERLFRGYGSDDPLLEAQDLFGRASTERPQSYWTQLSLAQVVFLAADRNDDPSWRKYDRAIQTIGRCIAIDEERSIAFADRSSMYRYQARAITKDETLKPELQELLVAERRRWSLNDAQRAKALSTDGTKVADPWVGWQLGLALFEVGQTGKAMDQFLETSILTHPIGDLTNVMFVGADDLRGREEAAHIATRMTSDDPDFVLGHVLLASIRLNQNRAEQAGESVAKAFEFETVPSHAYAIRGMLRMRTKQYAEAREDFEKALDSDPTHSWAAIGVAASGEQLGHSDEARKSYQSALKLLRTSEHQAAAQLGYARTSARLGMFDEASTAVANALQLAPASDLTRSMKPLAIEYANLREQNPGSPKLPPLREFLKLIARSPRVSRIEVPQAPLAGYRAALLNGDFELDTLKYWADPSGARWNSSEGYASSAKLVTQTPYRGRQCLRIQSSGHPSASQRGQTGQSLPLDVGGTYRLSLMARSDDTQADAIEVLVNGEPVLKIPAGSYEWTEVAGEFDVPVDFGASNDQPRKPIVSGRVEIVASGRADVWLDELEVWKLPAEAELSEQSTIGKEF